MCRAHRTFAHCSLVLSLSSTKGSAWTDILLHLLFTLGTFPLALPTLIVGQTVAEIVKTVTVVSLKKFAVIVWPRWGCLN